MFASGAGPIYHRLWPVKGVIVHKTHITYGSSAAKMTRIKRDFARRLLLRALARSAAFLTKILGLCPAR
jgi:hypothetical protein